MPTPLEDLQASYASACAAYRAALLNPQPNYTLPGGASVDFDGYVEMLASQIERLRAIPGVDSGDEPGIMTVTALR